MSSSLVLRLDHEQHLMWEICIDQPNTNRRRAITETVHRSYRAMGAEVRVRGVKWCH